ncbi:hypothetical protein TNCV_5140101 [Trichonephila clavipes]|nr:hypothetical protein TNCV_5140101 [Trichonephila clavipes]
MLQERDVRWHPIGQKAFHERRTYFPKPTSKVGDPPCAKGRCSLYAFPNRQPRRTIARTRSRLRVQPATRETCEHSGMAEAVREAVDENDGKGTLLVAVDGSWQKREVFLRRMAW